MPCTKSSVLVFKVTFRCDLGADNTGGWVMAGNNSCQDCDNNTVGNLTDHAEVSYVGSTCTSQATNTWVVAAINDPDFPAGTFTSNSGVEQDYIFRLSHYTDGGGNLGSIIGNCTTDPYSGDCVDVTGNTCESSRACDFVKRAFVDGEYSLPAITEAFRIARGCGTHTATATVSETPTLTATATISETPTLTSTATATSTVSYTPTFTATDTGTFTATSTLSETPTFTATATSSFTGTATSTVSDTLTSTATATATSSFTATSSDTATATGTFTSTATSTVSETPTMTATATSTVSNSPTATATAVSGPRVKVILCSDVYDGNFTNFKYLAYDAESNNAITQRLKADRGANFNTPARWGRAIHADDGNCYYVVSLAATQLSVGGVGGITVHAGWALESSIVSGKTAHKWWLELGHFGPNISAVSTISNANQISSTGFTSSGSAGSGSHSGWSGVFGHVGKNDWQMRLDCPPQQDCAYWLCDPSRSGLNCGATGTATATATETTTFTATSTLSETPTLTLTATATSSLSETFTATSSATVTATATSTLSATPSTTGTTTATATVSDTATSTVSATATSSFTATATSSLTPTMTATATATATSTEMLKPVYVCLAILPKCGHGGNLGAGSIHNDHAVIAMHPSFPNGNMDMSSWEAWNKESGTYVSTPKYVIEAEHLEPSFNQECYQMHYPPGAGDPAGGFDARVFEFDLTEWVRNGESNINDALMFTQPLGGHGLGMAFRDEVDGRGGRRRLRRGEQKVRASRNPAAIAVLQAWLSRIGGSVSTFTTYIDSLAVADRTKHKTGCQSCAGGTIAKPKLTVQFGAQDPITTNWNVSDYDTVCAGGSDCDGIASPKITNASQGKSNVEETNEDTAFMAGLQITLNNSNSSTEVSNKYGISWVCEGFAISHNAPEGWSFPSDVIAGVSKYDILPKTTISSRGASNPESIFHEPNISKTRNPLTGRSPSDKHIGSGAEAINNEYGADLSEEAIQTPEQSLISENLSWKLAAKNSIRYEFRAEQVVHPCPGSASLTIDKNKGCAHEQTFTARSISKQQDYNFVLSMKDSYTSATTNIMRTPKVSTDNTWDLAQIKAAEYVHDIGNLADLIGAAGSSAITDDYPFTFFIKNNGIGSLGFPKHDRINSSLMGNITVDGMQFKVNYADPGDNTFGIVVARSTDMGT